MMSRQLPYDVQELLQRVVDATEQDRQLPLTMYEAAQLREHGLIDDLARPTALGMELAHQE